MKKTCMYDILKTSFLYLAASLAFCVLCPVYARADVMPKSITNPPPKYELSRYDKFIAEPIVISEEFKEQEAKNRAAAKSDAEKSGSTSFSEGPKENEVDVRAVAEIQRNLDNKLKPLLQSWNKDTQDTEAKTLIIKPIIESIHINHGNAYGGKSIILMRVMIADQKTGEVIANPEFYQHANSWGAAYSGGATNNAMLNRVSELVVLYMSNNYKNAVGGKTGAVK